ncbi:MAG: hypothetical protein ABJB69_03335 [Spartobacteria bacterium]
MISRNTVNRHGNFSDEAERFAEKRPVLDQVAGETDKIGPQPIDRGHDLIGVFGIASVMEIAEMNEATLRSIAQWQCRHTQSRRHPRIRAQHRRQRERAEPKEFSPTDLRHRV